MIILLTWDDCIVKTNTLIIQPILFLLAECAALLVFCCGVKDVGDVTTASEAEHMDNQPIKYYFVDGLGLQVYCFALPG